MTVIISKKTILNTIFGLLFLYSIAPVDATSKDNISTEKWFCNPNIEIHNIEPSQDCKSKNRVAKKIWGTSESQFIFIKINNLSTQEINRILTIAPYFIPQINIYEFQNNSWSLTKTGGANFGGNQASSNLGSHKFSLKIPPGKNQFLIKIRSENFSHLFINVEEAKKFNETILLAAHIGMLLLLSSLMLVAYAIEQTKLRLGLVMLSTLITLSVIIGSGSCFLIFPSIPPGFNNSLYIILTLRITCLIWIYYLMINSWEAHRYYKYSNYLSYALAVISITLFMLSLYEQSFEASFILLISSLVTPSIGIITTRKMPLKVKLILGGSIAFYATLYGISLLLTLGSSGETNAPVYISRVLDLSLPIGMLAGGAVNNRLKNKTLIQTLQNLAAKETALEIEHAARIEKRLLLDMLTHEIKNPLASISLAISALHQNKTKEPDITNRRIDNISHSVKAIDQIIELCNLANQIEDQHIHPNIVQADLTFLIQEVVKNTPNSSRIILQPSQLSFIETDMYLFQIVISNLIDNALKYSPSNTQVIIEQFTNQEQWGVRVLNKVIPNSEIDPQKIFERYYRGSSSNNIRGSGLGLPLCKEICKLLDGKIDCKHENSDIFFEVKFKCMQD